MGLFKTMKGKLIFFALFLLAIPIAFAEPARDGDSNPSSDAVILVIRHAEKPNEGSDLSAAGETRAEAYVNYFKNFKIDGQPLKLDYLFASRDSTASDRPDLTIAPTANALGLTIDSQYDNNQFQKLADDIQSRLRGKNILICWHHGNIPGLLQALGANPDSVLPNGKWPSEVFGWLIMLRYDENGHLLESKRINENLSPDSHREGSWLSMQRSLGQFLHPEFILRLFLSLLLAVVCAWVIAWHPRSSRLASLSDLEERKTLLLLGMVGAIVAELSRTSQTLAFVIFGIGALMRFRTVLDNPKLTVKAITVVVIGLACGMGLWVMAVFVTAFTWVLIFWVDSRIACRLRIRLADEEELERALGSIQSMLVSRGCRLQNSGINKAKRQLELDLHIPAELDLRKLEFDLRAMLPQADDARIAFDVV
jgi:hypothetical protein